MGVVAVGMDQLRKECESRRAGEGAEEEEEEEEEEVVVVVVVDLVAMVVVDG